MKFMVGVLALAAVCRAVPEADPQFLLGPSPLTTPYASPFPYTFGNFYNPYINTLPVATPVLSTKVIRPIVATPNVAGIIPQARPYTPRDCVTAAGCAVLTLKEHGLAKREATAEADAEASADPEAFYGSYYNPYNGFNGLYNGYYPYSYGAYPYGVNSLWNYAAAGRGYATGFEGYPASTAPLPALPARIASPLPTLPARVATPFPALPARVAAPLAAPLTASPAAYPLAAPLLAAPAPVLRTVQIPAPAVKTIEFAAPLAKAIPATPLPVFQSAPFVHAPLPVVRQPVLTPIVKKVSKPVTYTHLGAHPIQPTTVFEETHDVVGHNFF